MKDVKLARTEHEWLLLAEGRESFRSVGGKVWARTIHLDKLVSVVRAWARRTKREERGPVVVDQLSLIGILGRGFMTARDRLLLITYTLKLLAMEIGVPIALLVQVNSDCKKRDGKRPRQSDLKESGSIKEDADAVVFMCREPMYDPDADPMAAEAIVAKCRDGVTGTANIRFEGHFSRFLDMAYGPGTRPSPLVHFSGMLRRLDPEAAHYNSSHPDWVEHVAKLIREAGAGTVFGLYGRWGTGKSSAVMAVLRKALSVTDPGSLKNKVFGSAYVSVSDLLVNQGSLEDRITAEVSLSADDKDRNGKLRQVAKTTAKYLKAMIPVAKAIPEPVTAATTAAATGVVAGALQGASAPSGQAKDPSTPAVTAPEDVDVILVVLDDLDRCSPDEAWRFLQAARWVFRHPQFLTIVVCDPSVLGHHVASALGVDPVDGFAAISKYIDVPIRVPRSPPKQSNSYAEAARAVLESWPTLGWPLELVAVQHMGAVPVRDVLVALPQAAVWLSTTMSDSVPSHDGQGKLPDYAFALTDWALSLSIVHTCFPNAFDVLVAIAGDRGKKAAFTAAVELLKGDLSGPIGAQFGASVVSTLSARMGLVRHLASRANYRGMGAGKQPNSDALKKRFLDQVLR